MLKVTYQNKQMENGKALALLFFKKLDNTTCMHALLEPHETWYFVYMVYMESSSIVPFHVS